MWKPFVGTAAVAACVMGVAGAADTPALVVATKAASTAASSPAIETYTLTQKSFGEPLGEVDPAMRKAVVAILGDLGAETFSVRDGAQKKLIMLGDAAKGAIAEQYELSRQPEVRGRLQEVIEEIEEHEALKLPPVSLSLDAAKLDEFEDALSKALDVVIDSSANKRNDQQISVDARDQQFWQLMRKINRDQPLWLDRPTLYSRARVDFGEANLLARATTTGPFLFAPVELEYHHDLDLGSDEENKGKFSFRINYAVDPRVMVLGHSMPMFTEFVDDAGNNLIATSNEDLPVTQTWIDRYAMRTDLVYPENPGRRVAHIRGHAKFLIAVGTWEINIPDVEKAAGEPIFAGGHMFAVDQTEMKNANLSVVSKLKILASIGPTEIKDGEVGELVYRDADGKVLAVNGIVSRKSTTLDNAKTPVSLRVTLPVRTAVVDIPFEFKNLPMP